MNRKAISAALKQQLSLSEKSKVLVVGLGVTGFSVAKFLQENHIQYAVVDSRDHPPLNDTLLQTFPNTAVFTGGFDQAAFDVVTHLVVSPGVSLQEDCIKKAVLAKARVVSDIDLFACATDKPIIAITGSNGKSTVTSMLGDMGNRSGMNTAVGGNLGVPALALLDDSIDLYVIELSSFQLERTTVLNATAATVLNISPDHLDRYQNLKEYVQEKQKVFAGNGVMILNNDDSIVQGMIEANRKKLTFSIQSNTGFHLQHRQGEIWLMDEKKPLIKQTELPLKGMHNVANALAALALGKAVGLNALSMCHALKDFKGLAHRMQCIATVKGVNWVNDSKATNIGACIAAMQGYQEKIVLIAGGDAKGAEISKLIPTIKEKAKCVVLMGKDTEKIKQAIDGCVPSYQAKTIKEAVQIAATMAEVGESVLLSPACASIDQFKNYQERGEQFTAAVMGLAA
ncbi:MAG: UDP-N-acetylmuramoyl-L-alanine--D-glutamate ligase [Methylococcales symbiont of Iophon sp. n. MRB-2018]|nr:MAG: UDP-N-acetylmuramoyl-L-alanine--D-glutamate ligase [Methylococcales symbiont of Iophon sp. n. MRB-2018]KAF3979390.1 MAG: UDP-N-acetylmuramoyl-L-alanine--D-glutamate ligase [Methylococcales symbiont of Iophon sp. n. MRB-2018]